MVIVVEAAGPKGPWEGERVEDEPPAPSSQVGRENFTTINRLLQSGAMSKANLEMLQDSAIVYREEEGIASFNQSHISELRQMTQTLHCRSFN